MGKKKTLGKSKLDTFNSANKVMKSKKFKVPNIKLVRSYGKETKL